MQLSPRIKLMRGLFIVDRTYRNPNSAQCSSERAISVLI